MRISTYMYVHVCMYVYVKKNTCRRYKEDFLEICAEDTARPAATLWHGELFRNGRPYLQLGSRTLNTKDPTRLNQSKTYETTIYIDDNHHDNSDRNNEDDNPVASCKHMSVLTLAPLSCTLMAAHRNRADRE